MSSTEQLRVEVVSVDSLEPDPQNARRHSARNLDAIAGSLRQFGQRRPLVVYGSTVIAGNGTLEAARSLGWERITITRVPREWTVEQARAYALADNRTAELAEWDADVLAEQLVDLDSVGWDVSEFGFEPLEPPTDPGDAPESPGAPTLAERFLIPPFTIFDQRREEWQARKRRWLGLGIRSELGRSGADTSHGSRGLAVGSLSGIVPDYYAQKSAAEARLGRTLTRDEFERDHLTVLENASLSSTGTSIFDPVLCEIAYRWFSPPAGRILDPFAGGSVRGIVAAHLGRHYTGVELRAEQVEANREQAAAQGDTDGSAEWITGDSTALDALVPAELRADLVFSCPPYADLEVYSDDPADLSTMPYPDFLDAYSSIIAQAVERLHDDRFAVWVVGDVRERSRGGAYRGLVLDTIRAFEAAGARLYNEGILISPVASLAVRVARSFTATRKLGKTHQQVLVFVKGDPKRATLACGDVEVVDVTEDADLTGTLA